MLLSEVEVEVWDMEWWGFLFFLSLWKDSFEFNIRHCMHRTMTMRPFGFQPEKYIQENQCAFISSITTTNKNTRRWNNVTMMMIILNASWKPIIIRIPIAKPNDSPTPWEQNYVITGTLIPLSHPESSLLFPDLTSFFLLLTLQCSSLWTDLAHTYPPNPRFCWALCGTAFISPYLPRCCVVS